MHDNAKMGHASLQPDDVLLSVHLALGSEIDEPSFAAKPTHDHLGTYVKTTY
jgi:hypothetical protein